MRWSFAPLSPLPNKKHPRSSKRRRKQLAVRSVGCDAFEILEPRVLLSDVPVTGDPAAVTLSFQDGVFPTISYSGTRDTKIRGDLPDRVFGNSSRLEIDGNPDMATLLKWDVSQVPAESTVLAATITVDVIKTSLDTFTIFESLQPWLESETTFNAVRVGSPWDISGAQGVGDRGTAVLGTITAPSLGTVAVDLNSAGLAVVQSWIGNPVKNHGIVFQNYEDASTDDLDFRSRESSGFGPMLTLTYREGAPPLNDPPVAENLSVTTDEDHAVPVTLSGGDADGDALTFTIVDGPANGILTGTAPSFTYTPNLNFHGSDSFRFKANDGRVDSALATVAITVDSINDRPHAEDVNVTTYLDTAVSIMLEGSDVDGDAMVFSIGSGPSHGRLDGNFPNLTYTPDAGYTGADVFSYVVSDGTLESAVAEVSFSILSEYTSAGIWIDTADLMALPTSGPAWEALVVAADTPADSPRISDQDDNTDVLTLAKALVGVRLGDQTYVSQTRSNIMAAIGTEDGGRTLALGRNLAPYIIAADLVGLSAEDDEVFRNWLRETLTEDLDGRTLQSTHEDRPNNWGTMSGASRAAAGAYLGDQEELARTAMVFKGYLGDRTSYAEFSYGSDLTWQADPENPVGINPKGATRDGQSIDGVLPDDMRRGGSITWPPLETGYPWEALQGAFVQAEILHRAGFATYEWEDQALLRAVEFLYGIGWDAEGDDEWQTWFVDARYGTDYAKNPAAGHGKIMGWTSWTHQPSEGPIILANGDAYSVAVDVVLNVSAPGVLLNDNDPEGDPLTSVLMSEPASGSLTLNGDGSFAYTPDPGFNGHDSFTYKATDGTSNSNVATVAITVNPLNTAPVAAGQLLSTNEDTLVAITLTGSDADGDPLTYSVVSGPGNGSLSGTVPNLTYTPSADFNGSDSFTFKVNDGSSDSTPATVAIGVNAVNDTPVAADNSYSVEQDIALIVPAPGVLAGDSDADGDALTAVLVAGPSDGTLNLNADGSFSYTPGSGFDGTDSFTYQANDGTKNSNSATVTITGDYLRVFTATSETTASGSIIANNYMATVDDDGIVETIEETRTVGKPSKRTSFMDHRWMFVGVNSAASFYLTASRPNNSDGDDFLFQYTTDGGSNWTHLATVATPSLTLYAAALPAAISGTVLVRVIDTDPNNSGNSSRETVNIDQMYFSTAPLASLVVDTTVSATGNLRLTQPELEGASQPTINHWRQRNPGSSAASILSSSTFELVQMADSYLASTPPGQSQNKIGVDAAGLGWNRVDLLSPLTHVFADMLHARLDDDLLDLLARSPSRRATA